MFHPIFAATDPSVFIGGGVETGVFEHSGVDEMIGEFSIDAFFIFRGNHGAFLSDLFGCGFIHSFGQTLLELDVLLSGILAHVCLGIVCESYIINVIIIRWVGDIFIETA